MICRTFHKYPVQNPLFGICLLTNHTYICNAVKLENYVFKHQINRHHNNILALPQRDMFTIAVIKITAPRILQIPDI